MAAKPLIFRSSGPWQSPLTNWANSFKGLFHEKLFAESGFNFIGNVDGGIKTDHHTFI